MMDTEAGHTVNEETARFVGFHTDIYCPKVDEKLTILGKKYIYNCPMCGEEL